jgi:cell pole-organizing protein PopZ
VTIHYNKNNIDNEQEGKIEDILKSIRGIIDNHNTIDKDEDDNEIQDCDVKENKHNLKSKMNSASEEIILELTKEVNAKNINSYLISDEVTRVVQEEISRLKTANEIAESNAALAAKMDIVVAELLKPLIQDWLNQNLPNIVEKIVSKEIQNIIRHK